MSEQPEEKAGPPTDAGSQPSSRARNVLEIVGWITAVFFWPVGLVIGGILASRDDKRGYYILGVSVAMIVVRIVFYVVLLNAAEDAQRGYYYE